MKLNAVLVCVASLLLVAADAVPTTNPAGPKNDLCLTAAIVVNKDTYTLDAAQSGKAFRDRVGQQKNARGGRAPGGLPKRPAVDLTFRITNHSDTASTISVGDDDSRMQLALTGPGAVTVENLVAMT